VCVQITKVKSHREVLENYKCLLLCLYGIQYHYTLLLYHFFMSFNVTVLIYVGMQDEVMKLNNLYSMLRICNFIWADLSYHVLEDFPVCRILGFPHLVPYRSKKVYCCGRFEVSKVVLLRIQTWILRIVPVLNMVLTPPTISYINLVIHCYHFYLEDGRNVIVWNIYKLLHY
jgi:hypothetical protein